MTKKNTTKVDEIIKKMSQKMQEGLREYDKETKALPKNPPKPKSDEGAEWDPHADELLDGD